MWNGWGTNPSAPYFMAAKAVAANIPQSEERGDYTEGMFLQDFPQFTKASQPEEENGEETAVSLVPEAMLQMFIAQANDSVLPSRWGSMWRYAAGLYVAHFSTMYLKTWSDGSASAAGVAASAGQPGAVKQATMGDTSISYDNTAITAGAEKWGAWNSTQYGQQLVTMARMAGMGGMYVI